MVRELVFLPFRIAGKVAEGAIGLVRGGESPLEPPARPDQPARSAQPTDEGRQAPPEQPTRSTGGRDAERSDWDEDAPVPPGGSDPDDNLLADKVSSEVLGRVDVPKGEINLNVENGVVFLRGHLEDPSQVEDLVAATSEVDGVLRVENLIEA